jgi:hypothetical protein
VHAKPIIHFCDRVCPVWVEADMWVLRLFLSILYMYLEFQLSRRIYISLTIWHTLSQKWMICLACTISSYRSLSKLRSSSLRHR